MIASPQPATAPDLLPHPLGHVLLAEDDADFRELLTIFLRRHGYHVSSVGDASSLLRRLGLQPSGDEHPPVDVVVTDVYMPAGEDFTSTYACTGLRALRNLREAGSHVPVIVITGFGDNATHTEAQRYDVLAVLDKPFELDALLAAVDRARFCLK